MKVSNIYLRIVLKVIFLVAGSFSGLAQDLQFKNIGASQSYGTTGLPVSMDNYGNLWMSSDVGLYTYDGAKVRIYSQENYPEMPADITYLHYSDSKDRIWIYFGPDFHHLRIMNSNERMLSINLENKSRILGVFEASNNELIVAHRTGVYCYDEHTQKLRLNSELTALIPGDSLKSIKYICRNHILMCSSDDEVRLINITGSNQYIAYDLPIDGVSSSGQFDNNNLFLVSNDHQKLFVYDLDVRGLSELDAFAANYKDKNFNVVSLVAFKNAFYGISKTSVLYRFDLHGNIQYVQYPQLYEEYALPVGRAYNLFCFADGLLVVTHSKGISITNLTRNYISQKAIFSSPQKNYDNNICGILPDKNGNLYLSTFGGLIYWNRTKNEIAGINDEQLTRRFILGNSIIYKDKIYSTSFSNEIKVYDSNYNLFKKIELHSVPIVRNIYHWNSHYALLGTEDGIYVFNLNSFTLESRSMLPGIEAINGRIQWVTFTADYILIATSYANGAYRYHIPTGKLENWSESNGLKTNRIYSILQDSENRLYLGTRFGFHIVDKDGSIKSFDKTNGLKYDRIENLVFDRDSNIWFTNKFLIYKYVTRTQEIKSLQQFFLGSSNTFNILSYASIGDTIICFGGTDGLVYFHYKQDVDYDIQLKSGLKIRSDENVFKVIMQSQTFTIPYSRSILPIEIIVNDLMINDRCFFRYRLGRSEDWSRSSKNRDVFLSLRPGSYDFEFEVSLDDRTWTKSDVVLSIIVTPPFWQTSWFIFLVVCCGFGLMYLFYRYRVSQLLAVEKVRTKIAADLHDDVASTVSAISYYSEYGKSFQENSNLKTIGIFDKIGETAREAMENMRDVIWSTHSKFDNYDALKHKLMGYAHSLTEAKNIKLIWSDEQVSRLTVIKPLERRNVYLILKEAICNAVKYSKASTINVEVLPQNKGIIYRVSDNGIGFDLEKTKKGNGLENIATRAAQINATYNVNSMKNNGTIIEIYVR